MYKKNNIIILLTIIFTLLLLPLNSFAKEIPVTVKSGEAEKLYLEARMHDENLDSEKAKELYTKVIKLDPNCAMAYLNLSQLANSTKESDEYLQKAMSLSSKVSDGEQLIIEAAQASVNNNPEKAIKLLEKLTSEYPEDKRGHLLLSFSYSGRDKDDMAIEELKKCVTIDKNYAPAYNILGYTYLKTEQYDESEKAFKTYVSLIPDEANPHDSIADLYAKMGKHLEAIEHYSKAVELNPTFAISQRKIGDNLVFIGKFDEAREAYKKANTLETSEQGKITNSTRIALSYLHEGNKEKALTEMDNAISMAEKANLPVRQSYVLLNKAWMALNQDKTDIAEETISQVQLVLKNNKMPQYVVENLNKTILFNEALILAKEKNIKESNAKLKAYTKAVKDGNDPKEMENVHQLVGLIAIEQGDFNKATSELKMANQQSPFTLYNLGMAYNKAGNKEQANIFYKKAADWNVNGTSYAIIRNDAQTALNVLAGD